MKIGGEGTNRTYPGPRREPTTVLKTAGTTRHPSLSGKSSWYKSPTRLLTYARCVGLIQRFWRSACGRGLMRQGFRGKNKADALRRPLSTQTTKRTLLSAELTKNWRNLEQHPCCILPLPTTQIRPGAGRKCSIWRKVLGFRAFWSRIRRWRGRIAFSSETKFRFL